MFRMCQRFVKRDSPLHGGVQVKKIYEQDTENGVEGRGERERGVQTKGVYLDSRVVLGRVD